MALATASPQLAALWQRGCDLLGTELAIMGGAMSWVSERGLVSAISNAGGFGVIACGSMWPDILKQEIEATQALTKRPFGVNLIVMHPELENLIDTCIETNVTHVVLAGGIPKPAHIQKMKAAGIKVISFAPAASIAKRMIRNGIDALIIEGSEAGGHIGPVSLSVLTQEILPEVADQVPVFVAGGIGRGETMVSYLQMGAAGVQMGTIFVCASESIVHEKMKQAFVRASAKDAMPSAQLYDDFPVIPVRAIVNEASTAFAAFQHEVAGKVQRKEVPKEEGQLMIEHYWAGALRKAVIDGDIQNGSLMAGQSVGMVKAIRPVEEILEEFILQAELYLTRMVQPGIGRGAPNSAAHG